MFKMLKVIQMALKWWSFWLFHEICLHTLTASEFFFFFSWRRKPIGAWAVLLWFPSCPGSLCSKFYTAKTACWLCWALMEASRIDKQWPQPPLKWINRICFFLFFFEVPACELGLSAQVLWILSVIHDPGNVPTFPSLVSQTPQWEMKKPTVL